MATKREVFRLRQRHSVSKPLLGSEIVVAPLSSSSLPTLPSHHTGISSYWSVYGLLSPEKDIVLLLCC